jgi:hypothetical protein
VRCTPSQTRAIKMRVSCALVLAAAVLHVTALTTTYPRCARARPGPAAARAALQHVRLAMDEDEVSMGVPPKWQSIRPVDEDAANQNYDYDEEDEDEDDDDEDDEPVVKKPARQIGLGDSTVNAALSELGVKSLFKGAEVAAQEEEVAREKKRKKKAKARKKAAREARAEWAASPEGKAEARAEAARMASYGAEAKRLDAEEAAGSEVTGDEAESEAARMASYAAADAAMDAEEAAYVAAVRASRDMEPDVLALEPDVGAEEAR